MESKFTFEQFEQDVKDNAKRILSGKFMGLKSGKTIFHYISDDKEINAKASRIDGDPKLIMKINKGLLEACYEYIDTQVREYYSKASKSNNLTEEMFLRFVAGAFSEMIFWHEYSHIARGHLDYLDNAKKQNKNILECKRILEIDADIYGSTFLFARLYAIYLDSNFSLEDIMQVYAISIRATFEVLHRDNETEDFYHKCNEHPHSLLRAYTAITHGISSPIMLNLPSPVVMECSTITMRELLQFESSTCCTKVDPEMLEEFMITELNLWSKNKTDLDKYMDLELHEVPFWTKVTSFLRRIKS